MTEKNRIEGATHVAEIRPREKGSGFEIVSRARIIGWQQDTDGTPLPLTAYGVVARAAFRLSAADPGAGCSWIEVRRADGTRGWTLPDEPAQSLSDAALRGVLRRSVAGTAQPREGFAALSPKERGAHVARMREVQARSQRGGGTAQLRAEIAALKKRYGVDE